MRLSRIVFLFNLLLITLLLLAGAVQPRPVWGRNGGSPGPTEITELEDIIEALDESIENSRRTIDRLAAQIESTEREMVRTEEEIADAGVRLSASTRLFGRRVRSAYMNGGIAYLEILLSADNFGDLILRSAYLKRILERDTKLIASIKRERALIEQRKEAVEEQGRKLAGLMEQARAEHGTMLAQRQEKEKLLKETVERTAGYEPVYGVVLDNSSQARPQSGLAEASIVYEFEVEGKVTRYLALFSVFPVKVGPIRSARTHSIQLALENRVHYIYASGSSDVRETIMATPGFKNTNALFGGSAAFYRSSDRKAPHNLYVNLAQLGKEPPSSVILVRPAFLGREGQPGSTISLEYNSFTKIKYSYRPDKRDYLRYLNGQVHRDSSGKEITARNILIQYVPHYIDPQGRPTPNLIGSGTVEFYSMGQRFNGTWRKEGAASPTRFFYSDGQPIEMVYGRTWIQIARGR